MSAEQIAVQEPKVSSSAVVQEQLQFLTEGIPALEDIDQAREIVEGLTFTEKGAVKGPDSKFVKVDAANKLAELSSEENWLLDPQSAEELRSVVSTTEAGKLPEGMKRDFNLGIGEQTKAVKESAQARLSLDAAIRQRSAKEENIAQQERRATAQQNQRKIDGKRTIVDGNNAHAERAEVNSARKAVFEATLKEESKDLAVAKASLKGTTLEKHLQGRQLELEAKQRAEAKANEAAEARKADIANTTGGVRGVKQLQEQEEKAAWRERMGIKAPAEKPTDKNETTESSYKTDPTATGMSYAQWLEAGGAAGAKERAEGNQLPVSKSTPQPPKQPAPAAGKQKASPAPAANVDSGDKSKVLPANPVASTGGEPADPNVVKDADKPAPTAEEVEKANREYVEMITDKGNDIIDEAKRILQESGEGSPEYTAKIQELRDLLKSATEKFGYGEDQAEQYINTSMSSALAIIKKPKAPAAPELPKEKNEKPADKVKPADDPKEKKEKPPKSEFELRRERLEKLRETGPTRRRKGGVLTGVENPDALAEAEEAVRSGKALPVQQGAERYDYATAEKAAKAEAKVLRKLDAELNEINSEYTGQEREQRRQAAMRKAEDKLDDIAEKNPSSDAILDNELEWEGPNLSRSESRAQRVKENRENLASGKIGKVAKRIVGLVSRKKAEQPAAPEAPQPTPTPEVNWAKVSVADARTYREYYDSLVRLEALGETESDGYVGLNQRFQRLRSKLIEDSNK